MTKEEIIAFLKDNLDVEVEASADSDDLSSWIDVRVRLTLCGEVISDSSGAAFP